MTDNDYVELIFLELYAHAAFEADDCDENLSEWAHLSRTLSRERANRAASRAPQLPPAEASSDTWEAQAMDSGYGSAGIM